MSVDRVQVLVQRTQDFCDEALMEMQSVSFVELRDGRGELVETFLSAPLEGWALEQYLDQVDPEPAGPAELEAYRAAHGFTAIEATPLDQLVALQIGVGSAPPPVGPYSLVVMIRADEALLEQIDLGTGQDSPTGDNPPVIRAFVSAEAGLLAVEAQVPNIVVMPSGDEEPWVDDYGDTVVGIASLESNLALGACFGAPEADEPTSAPTVP
jgi:hypothetical protein